jgi:hypothetical protein
MKKLPKQIKAFLEFAPEAEQTRLIASYKAKIKESVTIPIRDPQFLEYWAWRIAFASNWSEAYEIEITFDNTDLTEAVITIKPDYGS